MSLPQCFFQIANCMFCAPMGAILPELVPRHQQASSGAWGAFWGGISGLIGSVLGIGVGSAAAWAAWLNMTSVYVLLSALNILGLWLGVLAFSARPGCCELEAKPPPLELSTPGRGGCREVIAFLAPFRHRPFHCMFWFLFLQSIANIVATYFTQCAQQNSLPLASASPCRLG